MYRLFNCIVTEHDLVLVLLASTICAGTVVSAYKTFGYALGCSGRRREFWLTFAGASAASGIWATHFVAMLAYVTPVPVFYNVPMMALSLAAAMLAAVMGLRTAAQQGNWQAAAGGAMIGAGAGAMHFVGMAAIESPGSLVWTPPAVAAAQIIGVLLAAASMHAYRTLDRGRAMWAASLLMLLAICGLHFTAMSAVTLVPDPTKLVDGAVIDRTVLAIGIAALAAFGLAAGLAALAIERLQLRIETQLKDLRAQIAERQHAEQKLRTKQEHLKAHQTVIANLMQDEAIRSGTIEGAFGRLSQALAHGLSVDRVGTILLDKSTGKVSRRAVYVAAKDSFEIPEFFGTPEHLAFLLRTSPSHIVTVDDTSQENALADFFQCSFKPLGIQSTMHAPIIAHGECVGYMTCASVTRKIEWGTEHRLFALGIATLAALVVERHTRLELEVKSKSSADRLARQQVLLNHAMRSEGVRSGNLQTIFQSITPTLCREMQVDRVSVRLFSDGIWQHVAAAVYFADQNNAVNLPRLGTLPFQHALAEAIKSGPIAIEDCACDPLTAEFYATDLEPRRIRAMLHAPIQNGDEVIGVIAYSSFDTPRKWFPEDVLLAAGVANIVALATERRARLQVEENLREASKAKSLFLANMSHEIRTPMNGVLGMTDFLARTELTERQRRLTGIIAESARSLLTIINDILDISRIEGGKLALDPHDFDLARAAEDTVELLAEQASKKAIGLNLYVDSDAKGIVHADSVRLRQVLINLIGNAIKFTNHGDVAVRISVATDDGTGGLRFTVADTGIGIDKLVQQKLFQPFTQADTSITRRFGGTGLGLSISRHLVELMGGQLAFDSEPGKGTRVTFTLPLSVRPAQEQTAVTEHLSSPDTTSIPAAPVAGPVMSFAVARPEASCGAQNSKRLGLSILVAEDNPVNQIVAEEYLTSLGCTCTIVENGLLAVEAAAREAYDVILMDCQMPEMDGYTATRTIRAGELARGVASTPIVAVTANAFEADRRQCLEAGMSRYLSKPYSEGELHAELSPYAMLTADPAERDFLVRQARQPTPAAAIAKPASAKAKGGKARRQQTAKKGLVSARTG